MNKKMLIVGSANMDVCLRMDMFPKAGENILIHSQELHLGGKGANRAVAAARLGADVLFSCRVGDDAYGREMLSRYEKEGIGTELVGVDPTEPTGTAYILVEKNGANRILVNAGSNFAYGQQDIEKVSGSIQRCGAMSLELEIPLECTEKLIWLGERAGIPVIIDAGPRRDGLDMSLFKGTYMVSPNESEAEGLTGICPDTREKAEEVCRQIFLSGTRHVLLKMGEKGSLWFDGKKFFHSEAKKRRPAIDTTGAGDTYMSALIYRLMGGADMETAMSYAGTAASITVSRVGTMDAMPTGEEVEAYA